MKKSLKKNLTLAIGLLVTAGLATNALADVPVRNSTDPGYQRYIAATFQYGQNYANSGSFPYFAAGSSYTISNGGTPTNIQLLDSGYDFMDLYCPAFTSVTVYAWDPQSRTYLVDHPGCSTSSSSANAMVKGAQTTRSKPIPKFLEQIK